MRVFLFAVFSLALWTAPSFAQSGFAAPGWLIFSQTSYPNGHLFVTFIRVTKPRDAGGKVEYDEASFANVTDDYFGFITANTGKCADQTVAMRTIGKVSLTGEITARSLKPQFMPLKPGAIEYKVLGAICKGSKFDSVADPLAFAHKFLGR